MGKTELGLGAGAASLQMQLSIASVNCNQSAFEHLVSRPQWWVRQTKWEISAGKALVFLALYSNVMNNVLLHSLHLSL